MRRGIADLDGEGETVGGIVVMRFGENAQKTIDGVKAKLEELKQSLPDGVEIVTVYDRSGLIERAVENLWFKLHTVCKVCICLQLLSISRTNPDCYPYSSRYCMINPNKEANVKHIPRPIKQL